MKALVDTSVWSLALRRKEQSGTTRKLADLVLNSLAVIIGPIRQELLSGISDVNTFTLLKTKLEAFEDVRITTNDYVTAAQFYNTCRKHGIQGSHTDFLICSVACNHHYTIFSTDRDFEHYRRYLPIKLENNE